MRESAPYWALRLWLAQFLGAFYAVAVAAVMFGNALGVVIDVVLPLQLLLPLPIVATLAVRVAIGDQRQGKPQPSWTAILSCLLSPFTALTGYVVFARYYNLGPVLQSSLYRALAGEIDRAIASAAAILRDLHAPFAGALTGIVDSLWPQLTLAALSLLLSLVHAKAALRRPLAIAREVPSTGAPAR